tara:strand:+ start:21094 stop:22062 length:969 start_codon:yes stop_codon:yes gene_type:complete
MSSRRNISFNQLVEQLFNTPVPPISSDRNKEIKPTTIRPDANTVHFFSYHAARLGISMQDMMALALNAVVFSTSSPAKTELQLAVDRFKFIFDAHKVPQIHVKRIIDSFGQNRFPLGGMTNDKIFLENYSPSVKEAISLIFGVRKEWLSGTDDRAVIPDPIYSRDYAYSVWRQLKNPSALNGIDIDNRSLLFVKSENISINDLCATGTNLPSEVILISVIQWKVDSHMRFKTYHLNGIFPLDNKEARICLEALLDSAKELNEELNLVGVSYNHEVIHGIKLGHLPADCINDGFPSIWDPKTLLLDEDNSEVKMLTELLLTSE